MSGWNQADVERLRDRQAHIRAEQAARFLEVRWLVDQGCPWSVIAEALGVTRQSAHRKYRRPPSDFVSRVLGDEYGPDARA